VTYRVRVLPSGHEFPVEGAVSLLDAALKAGLAPDYGCNNGTCGLCKARVVSGEVRNVRPHDYALTEAEKNLGYVLMCSSSVSTDLVIEAPEAWGVQDIPLQQILTRVKRTQELGQYLRILELQTPRTQRLRFLAGQYATLTASGSLRADYSIASCPCDGRNLEFHIPRHPGHAFSDYVFGAARVQDIVPIEGPKGRFTLRNEDIRPVIFLACDTGFAPIKSLVEQAMAVELTEPMHFYWLATPDTGHYMHNLCRSWLDALDNFRYTPLALDAPGHSFPVVAGPGPSAKRSTLPQMLRRIARDQPELCEYDVYIAGPENLLKAAEHFFTDQGLSRDQLCMERVPRQ
jgi:CDP-4-dehydro-6-deoxyglucose reductase